MGDSRRAGRPGSDAPVRSFVPIVVVLALAVATAVLSWPRLIGAVVEAPFENVVLSLQGDASRADTFARRAAAAKEHAASVHETAHGWADIGLIRQREATRAGLATAEGRAALDASLAAHRRALELEPAQAFVLTRLAQGMLMRDGPENPRVPLILDAAIKAAPYDPNLVVARVTIALAAWDFLDPDLQAVVADQIHIAADQAPADLAAAAAQWLAFPRVVLILGDDPRLLKRFAFAYTRL